MCWDTRLSFACDWFLQKGGRSFFAVAVQCWHHSDLHCLFCYDDDELHLTSCDRESLLQSWQKEKKKGSSAELQHVPHVYALLRFCGPDPLPPRRSFFAVAVQCWHHSDLHCLFCYDDDELHLTSCDRESLLQSWQKEKKKGSSAELQHIYIHTIHTSACHFI